MRYRLISVSLALTCLATGTARASVLPQAPHALPSTDAKAAAAESASWIVGARPGAQTAALAREFGAREISARGSYEITRARARTFAAALRDHGLYRFSEADVRFSAAQVPPDPTPTPTPTPPPYDEFAATDWRAYLLGTALVPPPLTQAPLTAVIDSGVDTTHPDLAGVQVIGNPAVTDLHGTAVASVIGGRQNGVGMVGVYPGAPIVAVGSGLLASEVTKAIAMANDAGARVINMSLGGPTPSYAMFVELAYAVSRGALPVASAGNEFNTAVGGQKNPVEYPAAFPHVLSVAAIGPSGASSSFSTANGAVDVAAPGESVLAAVPVAFDDDGTKDGYERLAGTSFASPIVAGTAAWLMAARPNLSGAQVADVLRYSATDTDKAGYDSNTGYGVVNLGKALTQPDPAVDSAEVNDDIEWVNGKRFSKASAYLFKARSKSASVAGLVDAWKDTADVFRIEVKGRGRVRIQLRTNSKSDPDLAVYSGKATTIYSKKRRLAVSARGQGRTESVTIRNSSHKKERAYVAVLSPDSHAKLLDAPYVLKVTRLKQ